jgi:hypothetical protein
MAVSRKNKTQKKKIIKVKGKIKKPENTEKIQKVKL